MLTNMFGNFPFPKIRATTHVTNCCGTCGIGTPTICTNPIRNFRTHLLPHLRDWHHDLLPGALLDAPLHFLVTRTRFLSKRTAPARGLNCAPVASLDLQPIHDHVASRARERAGHCLPRRTLHSIDKQRSNSASRKHQCLHRRTSQRSASQARLSHP